MGEQGVIRVNVSVPRELKARMDAIEESVNWSGVAARAFEDELRRLQSERKAQKMDEVIARLKAAAEIEENEEYQDGFEAGQKWAKSTATPKQLRRLAEYVEGFETMSYDWWDVDEPRLMAPFGATDYFLFALFGRLGADNDAKKEFLQEKAEGFLEEALGDNILRFEDVNFFHGFGEGALDIWDKVEDKL
jgi:hypothetical protein